MTLTPGSRVQRTDTHEYGVVKHGGTLLRRLVAMDDGSTEYVHVDYLKPSTEPLPDHLAGSDHGEPVDVVVTVPEGSSLSDLEAASETPEDDAPLIVEAAPAPARRPGLPQSHWTRDTVLASIREWAAQYGHPPVQGDWDPGIARAQGHPERAQLFLAADGHWPSAAVVKHRFGTWGKAIAAAGFETPRSGVTRGRRPSPQVPKPEVPAELDAPRAVQPQSIPSGGRTRTGRRSEPDPPSVVEAPATAPTPPDVFQERVTAATAHRNGDVLADARARLEHAIAPITHEEALGLAELHAATSELWRAIARVKKAAA